MLQKKNYFNLKQFSKLTKYKALLSFTAQVPLWANPNNKPFLPIEVSSYDVLEETFRSNGLDSIIDFEILRKIANKNIEAMDLMHIIETASYTNNCSNDRATKILIYKLISGNNIEALSWIEKECNLLDKIIK